MKQEKVKYIATTRLTNITHNEINAYKIKKNINYPIYGCPLRISNKITRNAYMYVIEMNNDINEILGISLIKNTEIHKRMCIYSDNFYNNYVYKGNRFISKSILMEENRELVEILEQLCFYGKSHMKRMMGISLIKEKILNEPRTKGMNLLEEITKIFEYEYIIRSIPQGNSLI